MARGLFVAQQWLQPGDRVLLHTHPVEEAITFLSGSGEATLGEEIVPIGAGVSLYIPAGEVHGFRCIEGTLHASSSLVCRSSLRRRSSSGQGKCE